MLEELLALAMLDDRRRQLDRLVLVLDARASTRPTGRRAPVRRWLSAWLRPAAPQVGALPRDVRLEQ